MEKLWTTSEVARFLGIDEAGVERLVKDGKLTGYRLAGQFVRFRPDQVKDLRSQLAPRAPAQAAAVVAAGPERLADRLRDAWYFYDFYVVSFVLLAGLVLYLVASG